MANLRTLLRPSAYQSYARSRWGRWLAMRRLARNWVAWIVRDLLQPFGMLPLIVHTRAGAQFRLEKDPIDDRILRHLTGAEGADLYFPPAVRLAEGDLILDIGAHSGIYAVEALRRYPGSRLIAVEPNPAGCERIRRNLALNGTEGRGQVVHAAIGPSDGMGWLTPGARGSWGDRGRATPLGEGSEVPMRTIRRILSGEAPALVKCNAEGAEFDVFPQMFAAGIRPGFVILMVHGKEGSVGELLALFRATGYEVVDADTPAHGRRFHCRLPAV